MTQRLRIQHLVVQPVLVLDDGEELTAGPEVQPVALTVSQIGRFMVNLPAELAKLQAGIDTKDEDGPTENA